MEQKTVLMVEDDEVIAVILHAMLVGLGYSVTGPVATGEAAIDAVAAIAGAPEDAPGFSYSGSAAAITKAEWSLDSEALNNLRALQRPGPPDLLGKLVASYLKETPPMLGRLRDAFERQDPESACRVAHSLKSSSAYLGATLLAAMFIKIESMARSNALGSVREMLPEVSEEFERVRQALLDEI